MAERTVNVNINYNVKTLEIEKLAQASMRAQQATDRLQQSSQKFNQQSSSGNMRAGETIEGLTVRMQRLRAQINLTNVADTKRLNSLRTQYQQVKGRVDAFNKSIEGSGKKAEVTQSKFNGLFNAVKLVFSVALVKRVVDMSLEMAKLSGNIEGVDRAFRRTFPDADLVLNRLRQATRGTVTDFVLMQRAIKASNFGIPINEMAKLLEFAATRAQQTGESVDYLVDSIINGIGRKSLLILDNLQISTSRVKQELGGVSVQAASTGQIVAAIAKVGGEELEKMGGFAETSATKVDQIAVSWERVREAFAKRITSGPVLQFFDDVLKGGEALIKAFEFSPAKTVENLKQIAIAQEVNKQALEEVDRLTKGLQGTEQERFDVVQQGVNSNIQIIGRYNDEIRKFQAIVDRTKGFGFPGFNKENIEGAKRFTELTEEFGSKAKTIFLQEAADARKAISHYEFRKLVIEETIRLLEQYRNAISQIGEAEPVRPLGLIEKLEEDISSIQEKIKQATVQGTIFDGSGNFVKPVSGSIAALNRQLAIMQGRLADLKKSGLPEFKSPEVIERIGKVLDEEVKEGAAAAGLEFLRIEETIARIDHQLRNMPKDPIPLPTTIVPKDFADRVGEAFEDARVELIAGNIDITNEFLQSSLQAEVESYRLRIGELQSFYADQISLAGDNERKKEQLRIEEARSLDRLRRQTAQKEKEARRFSIVIDTAASIAKTAATLGFPAAIPFILLAVANGAAQLAALNRAQVRGFAKGEVGIDGPGTGRSDSIPAMLSKGESIINSDATKKSYNLLEAINAKKIDDRVLNDLRVTREGVKVVGMDDKRIVEAIKGQQQVDVVRIGSQLYEVKNRTATYKRYIRSKSMGK